MRDSISIWHLNGKVAAPVCPPSTPPLAASCLWPGHSAGSPASVSEAMLKLMTPLHTL